MSQMRVPLMADWLRTLAVRAALSRAVRRMTGVAPGRLTELMAGTRRSGSTGCSANGSADGTPPQPNATSTMGSDSAASSVCTVMTLAISPWSPPIWRAST